MLQLKQPRLRFAWQVAGWHRRENGARPVSPPAIQGEDGQGDLEHSAGSQLPSTEGISTKTNVSAAITWHGPGYSNRCWSRAQGWQQSNRASLKVTPAKSAEAANVERS